MKIQNAKAMAIASAFIASVFLLGACYFGYHQYSYTVMANHWAALHGAVAAHTIAGMYNFWYLRYYRACAAGYAKLVHVCFWLTGICCLWLVPASIQLFRGSKA